MAHINNFYDFLLTSSILPVHTRTSPIGLMTFIGKMTIELS